MAFPGVAKVNKDVQEQKDDKNIEDFHITHLLLMLFIYIYYKPIVLILQVSPLFNGFSGFDYVYYFLKDLYKIKKQVYDYNENDNQYQNNIHI